jgi:CRISPR-associated protein Cst2
MATHYLYGTILTNEAVAANNRGDNIGNTTTLQKVFCKDDIHTSVSAEAIRFALRYRFQLESPDSVNRSYEGDKLVYADEKRTTWNPNAKVFIDDDLMGFMDAAAAAQEQEAGEGDDEGEKPEKPSGKGAKKAKGTTTKRQSPLAVGRAVSLRPYRGEISFNCVSGEKQKGKLSLYSAEMHTTEYQYFFGINLNDVVNKLHIADLIDAVIDPPQVAGNHSRFAYDFSPASIVLRLTNAHSSRIQNCFDHDEENRSFTVSRLIQRVESGDIPAKELILAGDISLTEEANALKKLGVAVYPGIYAASHEIKQRISKIGAAFAPIAGGVSV